MMIEVRYPMIDGKLGEVHKIEIKRIERIEKDGTFLLRGKENGYNVVVHLEVDGFGRFHKLPTKSIEYVKLMSPFVGKVDVTKNLTGYLDGQKIDSLPEEKKHNESIKQSSQLTPKEIYRKPKNDFRSREKWI